MIAIGLDPIVDVGPEPQHLGAAAAAGGKLDRGEGCILDDDPAARSTIGTSTAAGVNRRPGW